MMDDDGRCEHQEWCLHYEWHIVALASRDTYLFHLTGDCSTMQSRVMAMIRLMLMMEWTTRMSSSNLKVRQAHSVRSVTWSALSNHRHSMSAIWMTGWIDSSMEHSLARTHSLTHVLPSCAFESSPRAWRTPCRDHPLGSPTARYHAHRRASIRSEACRRTCSYDPTPR